MRLLIQCCLSLISEIWNISVQKPSPPDSLILDEPLKPVGETNYLYFIPITIHKLTAKH